MNSVYFLNIYDVSSMLYAGELAKPGSNNAFNFAGGSKSVDGMPIGGIRHVLRSVMLDLYQGAGVVLVFDSPTDKKKLFANYKGTRQPNPKVHIQQLMLLDVVKRLGIPYMKADTYEADDLVHAAVLKYNNYANNINIYSGDTDLAANLIRDRITLVGTASIYPTFDSSNYEMNIRSGCNIPYNSVLPYYLFFGKPSNNVPAFSDKATNLSLFNQYIEYCEKNHINRGHWSDKGIFSGWLLSCLEDGSLPAETINKIFDRIGYIFPKDYEGELPEKFISIADVNRNDLGFFLKVFNMDSLLQKFNMDEIAVSPRTPEMIQYIRQYRETYQNGCLAVDNDISPDTSIFSSSVSIEGAVSTDIFNSEDF